MFPPNINKIGTKLWAKNKFGNSQQQVRERNCSNNKNYISVLNKIPNLEKMLQFIAKPESPQIAKVK